MTQSVLSRLTPADIVYDPFPHVVVENALDPDWYAALAESYPSLEKVVGSRELKNNKAYLLNAVEVLPDEAIAPVWRDFFAHHTSDTFFREMCAFWDVAIAREYPDLDERFGKPLADLSTAVRPKAGKLTTGNDAADVMLDVQFGVNSPVTEVSRVRGPHVDKPQKLFAGLLYLRRPDDPSTGGDLGLYRARTERYSFDGQLDLDDRYVERIKEIPYRPNTLVMWLNTPRSLHGVSPRSVTDVPRRYVNFISECYRLSTDGFFPIRRSLVDTAIIRARKLVGLRD